MRTAPATEPGSIGLPDGVVDLTPPNEAATLREENDRRELAIYGLALPHMRFLRTSGWAVWLVRETSEWPDEFGVERVFMVGETPLFESEMVAKATAEMDKVALPDFLKRYKKEGKL